MATSTTDTVAEKEPAQRMLKFINYAWTPYHAVGVFLVLVHLITRSSHGHQACAVYVVRAVLLTQSAFLSCRGTQQKASSGGIRTHSRKR